MGGPACGWERSFFFKRTCSWATRASIRASAACLLFLAARAGEAAALLDAEAPVFLCFLFSQSGGAPRE